MTAIKTATNLSQELISTLKQETRLLTLSAQPAMDQLPKPKLKLSAARDSALKRLREMAGEQIPDAGEWQALTALRKLDCEVTLATLDRLIAAKPLDMQLCYHRAVVLAGLGRYEAAKQDFLSVLNREPGHFGALIDFGNLLLATGYISAARTLYVQAIAVRPGETLGHVNLGNLLQAQGEYGAARDHFRAALMLAPNLAEAHQGLSYALNGLGEEQEATEHRELGFRDHAVLTWPFKGAHTPISILILSSAIGGNIPLKHILDERTFNCTLLFTEYFPTTTPLPAHSLIFNAIGDADLCPQGLIAAMALSAKSPAPTLNPPDRVQLTGRQQNTERLRHLPGVKTPRCALIPRTLLAGPEAEAVLHEQGLCFPLLLRSPGFHTGQYFQRVETAAGLPQAINNLPGDALLAMELLDARNAEGDFHKYRVMFVDGVLYPLHLAVSKHWKVHYFTANMEEQPKSRQLEQAFLNDMPSVLGAKAMSALADICQTLGLDYAGIDFALSADGDILLFEANATMIIPPPDHDEKWRYRGKAAEQVLTAVRNRVLSRAASPLKMPTA